MNVEVIMPADDTSGFYEGELQKMNQVVNEINHMLEQKDLDASIHTNAKFHSLHITINECTNFGLIKLLANPDETGVCNYHNKLQAYCKLITPYPGKTIVYHFIPPFSFSKLNIPPIKMVPSIVWLPFIFPILRMIETARLYHTPLVCIWLLFKQFR